MYRYYLFYYDRFYPSGGMEDCVLKTDNFDDLMPFIEENYFKEWWDGTLAYYDALEDKYFIADIDYNAYSKLYMFLGWDEDECYCWDEDE